MSFFSVFAEQSILDVIFRAELFCRKRHTLLSCQGKGAAGMCAEYDNKCVASAGKCGEAGNRFMAGDNKCGVYEAILRRRTIRKFKQQPITGDVLHKLVNAARLAPSASNMQPLKYIVVDDTQSVADVFGCVKWAGYIAPAGNPAPDERPVAFIVILADTSIRQSGYELDIGAAAQNIMLAAEEEGIGTCWMGAIDRERIKSILKLPDEYIINTVIALGYKGEEPVSEDENGSIRYYKDASGILHVPKRRLKDIIIKRHIY